MFKFLRKLFGSAQDRIVRRYAKTTEQIVKLEEAFSTLSDDELRHKTTLFKERISQGESLESILPEAYAVIKNTCRRLIGTDVHISGYNQKWDMIPYDVQLIGAIALNSGAIAEMQTGEGKTLTAVLPLYLNALTGKPVHLVTTNDYLVSRDCAWVGSILRWHGLTTAALTNGTPLEKRKELYQADVVYGTASEFGFDYLRDNSMATNKEEQVQRGYYFAIIDEVDSILVDEARTPLIISGPSPVSRQMYEELKTPANDLVRMQRDLCGKLASEAKKTLEKADALPPKEAEPLKKEALYKLWLVSKGLPRNKVLMHAKEEPEMRQALDTLDLYYYNDQNKEERANALSSLFITVNEKGHEYELTDKGLDAWASYFGAGHQDDFVMLDLSEEYLKIDGNSALRDEEKVEKKLAVQEEDLKRKERVHNLQKLLHAHLLMEKDVDYIVQDGKIVIIDENTGRPQPGRRFADGLHQAIEAKESVPIQRETQTYATITLQNFFRMYDKLAGMTGTASTEAGEFKQIYKLDVVEIPSHKPCQRKDLNDEIYITEREKYNALLKRVKEEHAKGRPILLGTESVEISEKLSRIFKMSGLPHTVLNAKQHDKEAEVIAYAGKRGAITISTNMAGRGTDIKLESGVAEIGGLFVVGTTRHQSRRIDRQLRGRCARQGDPGSSLFYVSFEDSLIRLFASPKLNALIQRFRPPEGEAISAPILNRSIETAQKRVEQRNYMIRKHTLEYDDVMNKQRQEIYSFRNDILWSNEVEQLSGDLLESVVASGVKRFLTGRSKEWDIHGYQQWLSETFPITFPKETLERLNAEEIERETNTLVKAAFLEKIKAETAKIAPEILERVNPVLEAVRNIMIRKTDKIWQEHLLSMDHLRTDVSLRSVGQRDPLTEFKHEAFHLFMELSDHLRQGIAHDLFRFEIVQRPPPLLTELLGRMQMEKERSLLTEMEGERSIKEPLMDQTIQPPPPVLSIVEKKSRRNDLCPCGSGKKYKKCCEEEKKESIR